MHVVHLDGQAASKHFVLDDGERRVYPRNDCTEVPQDLLAGRLLLAAGDVVDTPVVGF